MIIYNQNIVEKITKINHVTIFNAQFGIMLY